MRERNTPRLVKVGAVETAGIGVTGVTETDVVGTVETGAKNMAKTCVMGVTGEVVVTKE